MRRIIKPPKHLWTRKQTKEIGSPQAALRHAESIAGDDRLVRGAAILDRALRQWPDTPLLLRARAALYRDAREFKQAEALLLKAKAIDGGEALTLEGLGLLYMASNRLADAEAALLEARRKAARSSSILLALASLYQHLAKRLRLTPTRVGRPKRSR